MANKLVKGIIGFLGGLTASVLGKYIIIFVISLLPILELRGGLIAASLMEVPIVQAFLVCLAANILVIPIVLFFVETLITIFSKVSVFKRIIDWFKEKTLKKKDVIEKYGYLGVMLFVAVPLPGSGAWTGCLLSVLLGLDKKKSFIAALAGVFIAGVIMLIFSYGILKGILG